MRLKDPIRAVKNNHFQLTIPVKSSNWSDLNPTTDFIYR